MIHRGRRHDECDPFSPLKFIRNSWLLPVLFRALRGRYIAMLDSDDCAVSDRLEKQVAFLDRHMDDVEVGSWVRAMDRDGRPLKRIKKQPVLLEKVKAQLLFNYCISHCSVMGRTAVLLEHGHRNDFFRC